MSQKYFHSLISRQSNGFVDVIAICILSLLAIIYGFIIKIRNFFYDKALLKSHPSNVAIISIGNITAGGTGKTPLVIWLCKQLSPKYKCAILTRGYKAKTHTDEPALLAQSCPGVEVIVNSNRVAGAVEATNNFNAEILIMDDGFQHRRLARDLDIVTVDVTCPFGFGKVLPAGLLREPVNSLKRAGAIVLTRCDQITENELAKIEKKIGTINPSLIIARSTHRPVSIKTIDDKDIGLEKIKGSKIFAFCGIGNPTAFLNTLKKYSDEPINLKIYDDHYKYTEKDISNIYKEAKQLNADFILTTHKDWTKISGILPANDHIKIAYMAIELEFILAEDKLRLLIKTALAGKIKKRE